MADEILCHSSENFFAIESEHQLCRRFNVSRVTVRLALSDLEAKGLIFRQHGRGTFAYGRLNRVSRSIGILLKTLPTAEQWPISEIIRGFHAGAAALRANVLLIHASPQEWSSDMIRGLGGVLLFPTGLTRLELDFLESIKMPSLLAWETNFPGYHIDFGQDAAAGLITKQLLLGGHERVVLVTGFEASLDARKKMGVLEALKSVGIAPEELVEFSMKNDEHGAEGVARLLGHNPRLTTVITSDESIASRLIEYLHKRTNFRIPEDVSVTSFHQFPFIASRRPDLLTVDFNFFEGGKLAAEALSRSSLTGTPLESIVLRGKIIAGSTVIPNCRLNRGISLIAS